MKIKCNLAFLHFKSCNSFALLDFFSSLVLRDPVYLLL